MNHTVDKESHGLVPRRRSRLWFLYGVFFFSGVAGLGYQMVWTRVFTLGLGHEMPSVLAVVAAFFGGLALGAWVLDGPVSRSRHPGAWYVGLEILIGVWGFASVAVIPWCNELGFTLIGVEPSSFRHWAVAFVVPLIALLPATFAMGATLPAMERFVSPLLSGGRCVGGLYAANTAGAVIGTLGSAFVLMPRVGLSYTVWALAVVNLLCAAAVAVMIRRIDPEAVDVEVAAGDEGEPSEGSWGRVGATVFVTGLLGIGYEVLGVRVMAQVLENTVYSFAAVLSIYLMGTAAGAGLYQRFGRRLPFESTLGYLIWGMSVACLGGIVMLTYAKLIYARARNSFFGDSLYAVMACEMIVALAVFALPTLLMGATFSHLVQAAKCRDGGVGRAAAINTLGAALAPCVFGVVVLPATGVKWALILASLGYLVLIPRSVVLRWINRRGVAAIAVVLVPVMLVWAVWTRSLQVITKYPNQQVVAYREGVTATVAVLQSDQGHRALRVNNRFRMGSTDGAVFEGLQAQTPLLLHPRPKRALFLGLGTAITFRAAAFEPGLEADGVELVPEIVELLPSYFTPANLPEGYEQRQKIYVADARRFVRATDRSYDVIVADLFHPGRDGAGSLYTIEHFQAVRDRLAEGGLFCQWLPLYQMDEPTLRVIVRTFLEVFPHTRAYLADFNIANPALGLVGTIGPVDYPADWFGRRVRDHTLRRYLQGLLIPNGVSLLGRYVAGREQLLRYAGDAVINTDDDPVVTFEAPRFTSQKDVTSYGRLIALIERCPSNPQQLIEAGSDDPTGVFAGRLAAFIKARDLYISGLVAAARNDYPEAIEALLSSDAMSEDFTTGYASCLAIIAIVEKQTGSDPSGVRALLNRLIDAQPQRPEARRWLARLSKP